MGYYSFVGHVLAVGSPDVSGLSGKTLAIAIGLGWLVALYALASVIWVRESGPR
jgi:hypothetical protein